MRVGKIKRTEKEKKAYKARSYIKFHTKAISKEGDWDHHISKIAKILTRNFYNSTM